MPQPDNARGPGATSPDLPDQLTAKAADAARVPRTTWDGHPSLSVGHARYVQSRRRLEPAAIDAAGVAVLEGELPELLGRQAPADADPEAAAYALLDRFGPTWCRRLGAELAQAVADVLAERRTPWGREGR